MLLATVTAHLLDVLPFGGPHNPAAPATPVSPAAIFASMFPWIVSGLFDGAIVLVVALKRRINPWVWTILALVPVFGWFVMPVFLFVTLLSILDRLHALEATARPAVAAGAATAEWTA
jgi:hypothetical protein